MSGPPVIVIGSGGHARVVIEALRRTGARILGRTDRDPAKAAVDCLNVAFLGDDESVFRHPPESVLLANGVGSAGDGTRRRQVFEGFGARGYRFVTIVHPGAVIAPDVVFGQGAQVMAGAVVQTGTHLGANAIVNTGARVDHDCRLGAHVHVAPGATVCGEVRIGEGSHIGAGATVVQGIAIGRDCLVAAGAVVVEPLGDGERVAGVPARTMVRA